MSSFSIPNICASIFLLALLVFVAVQTKSRWNERILAFLTFCIVTSIWQFTYGMSYSMPTEATALKWLKVGYSAVIFMPVTYLHFVASFIRKGALKLLIQICYFLSAVFLVTLHANLFLDGTYSYFFGHYPKAFPPVHLPFLVMMVVAVLTSMYIIYTEWRRLEREPSVDAETNVHQIKLVLLAFMFITISASDFLPNYGFEYYPIGVVCVVCFSIVITYTILRYNLHDIQVIVKRTLVFAGLVGSVVVVVSMVAFVSQDLLVQVVTIPEWLSSVLAAGIIAGVYGPLRNWLLNVTDKYLFQKKYDYKELLKRFTDEVMLKVDLKQLLQTTVTTLTDTVKLEGCSLLLLNKDKRTYELAASKGTNGQQLVLEEDEAFIKFLKQAHEPIGRDGDLGKVRFPEEVTERLKQLNARLCLPLEVHEDLIGVLCLGKKKSDEEFTKDDLDILLPLAKTLGIAISNAQLFDELARAQAEVIKREKLALVGTLAAGLAHEIKNPLTPIKTFTEHLESHYHDPEFREKFQRIVGREVERINHIVQQLLEFSKPMPSQLSPVDLPCLLDETVELFSNELLERRVKVERHYAENTSVMADSRQMRHVFVNLILNSLQAMDGSGGTLKLKTAVQDSQFAIQITDSGCGITPENLARIFEPFFTTKTKGTGLGLAIVQSIIQEHGGKITIQSELARGTAITLYLPIVKP